MQKTAAFATTSPNAGLAPFHIERRTPEANDVEIEILYCGVCHSDIHMARNEWGVSLYPLVPGHEIVGRVTSVGQAATKYKEGDIVGVGCFVDSCRECASCRDGLEQYCDVGMVQTYSWPDKKHGGVITMGGYSERIVVDENYVLRIPEKLEVKSAAPLLCAGITTYSPLRHWNVSKGHKVGVVGLGGLGHMAVKFAVAMGAEVTVITTSKDKEKDALGLGAKSVLISKDDKAMGAEKGSFDFILNTVPLGHDVSPYIELLKRDSTMCIVGALEELKNVNGGQLIMKRRGLAGSLIGGIAETQEMLDFCAEHDISCEVEMIQIQQINEAFEKVIKGDVRYRFVIDMESLKNAA